MKWLGKTCHLQGCSCGLLFGMLLLLEKDLDARSVYSSFTEQYSVFDLTINKLALAQVPPPPFSSCPLSASWDDGCCFKLKQEMFYFSRAFG